MDCGICPFAISTQQVHLLAVQLAKITASETQYLIPIVIQAALDKGESVTIFGTKLRYPRRNFSIRDDIHATDPAANHVLALDALAESADSNVHNSKQRRGFQRQEVIDMVEKVVGRPINRVEGDRRP